MVWKHPLFPKISSFSLTFEALKALGGCPSSIFNSIGKTQKFYSTKNCNIQLGYGSKKVGFGLSPQVVYSTLVNCSSDLVALSFFMWCARQPNYFHDRLVFGHMVNVAGRLAQRFTSVDLIVRELESIGCVTKAQTFLLLLRIFWLGGLYNMVFDVYMEMNNFGYTANTFVYNVLIDVCFKIDRKDMALGILRDTKNPNFLTYNIAICNLCKLNDLENMQGVLQVMLRSGYYPNAETFVKILNCFCKKGKLVQAFEIFGLMICLGIQVSVVVWSILIDGLCRIGRPLVAATMLDKMIGVGCSPNVVTYTTLLKAMLEYEMVDDALRILSLMENSACKPDLVLSNMLIYYLSKMGRYDEAMCIFFDLRKHNIEPDSYTFSSLFYSVQTSGKFFLLPRLVKEFVIPADLVVCNSLLSCLCKAGLPIRAVEFYHEMVGRGYMPDKYSHTILLDGLCRSRKIEKALKVYQGLVMSRFKCDAFVHTVMIDGLIKIGKYHQAICLFKQVVADDSSIDVITCTVAIEGLIRGGRVEEAWILYNNMKDLGFSPNARIYNRMISGLCKERDVDLVEQVLREMCDEGIELDYRTCISVSNFVFKSRYYFSVFYLMIKMWDLGLVSDSFMRALLLEGLSYGFIVGDVCSLLKKNVIKNSFIATPVSEGFSSVETSSSEDVSDMVASVG